MTIPFEHLSNEQSQLLLRGPVLISVFLACKGVEIGSKEKAEAIKLTHLKTFTSSLELLSYYKKVEQDFERNFEDVVDKYAPFDSSKCKKLKAEIGKLNAIISKLPEGFAKELNKSLSDYTEHVKHAEHSVVEDFVFPFIVQGLTD